jgi:hypothetical protein
MTVQFSCISLPNCKPNRDISVAGNTWRLNAQIYEAVLYLQGWTDSVIANPWRSAASLSGREIPGVTFSKRSTALTRPVYPKIQRN